MPLDAAYRQFVDRQLDECDAALADKPNLAAVFDPEWRKQHRHKMLNAASPADVSYPSSYAKPHNDMFYPPDYQQRLEEGAAVLLPKLDAGEKKHLMTRMRGSGCLSAEEELLLARGFAREFGNDAISFPHVKKGQDVPEFHVAVADRTIEIEAKGLIDEQEVRELNDYAIRSGQNSWFTFSQSIGDIGRLRAAVAKKLLTKETGDARVLVLTQYTAWIKPTEGVPLIRTMAIDPDRFGIPANRHALAIAYVTGRWIAGVWFNASVAERVRLNTASWERVRSAIRGSFYPRADHVFFDESVGEQQEQKLIAEMIRVAYGGQIGE